MLLGKTTKLCLGERNVRAVIRGSTCYPMGRGYSARMWTVIPGNVNKRVDSLLWRISAS